MKTQEVEREDPCPCRGGGISIASILFDGEIHDWACCGMYSCQPQVTTGVYLVVLWRVGTGHPEVTGWPPRPRYIYTPNNVNESKILPWASELVSPFFLPCSVFDSDCASHFEK